MAKYSILTTGLDQKEWIRDNNNSNLVTLSVTKLAGSSADKFYYTYSKHEEILNSTIRTLRIEDSISLVSEELPFFLVDIADSNIYRLGETISLLDSLGNYKASVRIKEKRVGQLLILAIKDNKKVIPTTSDKLVLRQDPMLKGDLDLDTGENPYLLFNGEIGFVLSIDSKKKNSNSLDSSGGAGAPSTYTNPNPTPTTIGGINAGSTFTSQTMQQMWDSLLYPYQAPSFNSFYINSQNSTLEVGDTSLANPSFRWNTTNSGNVQADSIRLRDTTGAIDIATGIANDGEETITQAGITKNTPSSQIYTIYGTNSKGASFNRNYTINWRWKMYYGESANSIMNEVDIKNLRASLLTNTYSRTYSMQSGATYKYIVYPISFGTATSFTDAGTGFAVAMEAPYTVLITNAFGQTTNYNVHRSTNILNGAIDIIVS